VSRRVGERVEEAVEDCGSAPSRGRGSPDARAKVFARGCEQWLAARLRLLDAEKELTRRGDELAHQRQALPWVAIEKEYDPGAVDYNYRTADFRPAEQSPALIEIASGAGVDAVTYRKDGPGMSAFALEDPVVHHTYSAYGRGVDGIWGMYSWLDRAPRGRNEAGMWWRRHDEYQTA
jgi:predicted dithiol-disulfide oxidoreductase (DUF899 family)